MPLDPAHPDGMAIALGLARRRATDAANRIGTLVIIAGGPGASGIEWLRNDETLLPASVLERFDIVAFDQRGLGTSAPRLECPIDPSPAVYDPDATDGAQLEAWLEKMEREVAACVAASGDLLPFLGTRTVAEDVERIRQALGEERITLFGVSYGTLVGELYANRYPDHVRALLLDAPLDPGLEATDPAATPLVAMQRQLDAFLAACAADAACPFYSGGAPRRAYDELMARFEQGPISGVTLAQARWAVWLGLYQADRTQLATALEAARNGGATELAELGSLMTADFAGYNVAVNCLDWPWPRSGSAWAEAERALRPLAPDFTGIPDYSLACAYWPVEPQPVKGTITAAGAPPILVIGSTGDPATPYPHAVSLAASLESGVLVTRDGTGHGSVGIGNACIDQLVEAYLLHLEVPAGETTCR